ncbi:MAG TPA: efflux RND transporter periplasmic adaptor subunit [Gemmatimonadales bacterium]|nr:efflux RND transporter periplasmic adaptor subunit [Gemmatimonadales bacterium]
MSRRTILLVAAAVIVAGAATAIAVNANRKKRIEVREERVARRDLVAAVTASGKIQPKKKVDLSADITGRITQITVHEGDAVTRGQFLLQIDPTVYEANLRRAQAAYSAAIAAVVQARANRTQAEHVLARTKQLHDESPNLVSPEQFEQAQTAFDVSQANLDAADHQVEQAKASEQEANDNLRKTRIVAPIAGRVTRLPVEEGEVAVPSTFSKDIGLLMTISDLSVVQAKVQVDETDVVRLKLGDSVEVAIDAFPDTTFTGRVTKISNSSIQAPTGTLGQNEHAVDYEVEVTLNRPPPDIRPDLSATARIVTDTRQNVLSIPIVALTVREHRGISTEDRPLDTLSTIERRRNETEGVFVIENETAVFRPVRVGIAGDEFFEVLDGLREGELIAAGPYQTIRDLKETARVRPLKQKADSAEGTGTRAAR